MRDPHSFSRPDEAAVRHLALDLDVDFSSKRLSGAARLDLAVREGAREVLLDTKDLTIESVTLDDGSAAKFTLGEPVK
ncbi:MAG TPA: aminopeptidase, partial [Thermoanaerobaculia bacterium]